MTYVLFKANYLMTNGTLKPILVLSIFLINILKSSNSKLIGCLHVEPK